MIISYRFVGFFTYTFLVPFATVAGCILGLTNLTVAAVLRPADGTLNQGGLIDISSSACAVTLLSERELSSLLKLSEQNSTPKAVCSTSNCPSDGRMVAQLLGGAPSQPSKGEPGTSSSENPNPNFGFLAPNSSGSGNAAGAEQPNSSQGESAAPRGGLLGGSYLKSGGEEVTKPTNKTLGAGWLAGPESSGADTTPGVSSEEPGGR